MITSQLLFEGQSNFFLIDHHHMLYLCLKFDACSSYFYLFEPIASRLRAELSRLSRLPSLVSGGMILFNNFYVIKVGKWTFLDVDVC
jgi:hypothetical protein